MNHNEVWPLLDEFLDGALGAEARWAVAAHLDECSTCRAQVSQQARLRHVVRGQVLATPIPDLDARLRAAIEQEAVHAPLAAAAPRVVQLAPRIAAVVGPALAAILLLLMVASPVTGETTAAADLSAAHFLFAQDESLFDVTGDAAVVARWFQDKAGLAVAVPDLADWTLSGGRLVVINGRPAAQLIYEAEPDTYLSVLRYQTPAAPGVIPWDTGNPRVMRQQGVGVISWSAGDTGTAIVGALSDQELRHLAETIIAS